MQETASWTRLLALALLVSAPTRALQADCAPCANPVEKWRWEGSVRLPESPMACSMPLVAQLTDDNGDGMIDCADGPDIVFAPLNSLGSAHIVALDGATGATLWDIPGLAPFALAVGDLDGDGVAEIVAEEAGSGAILAFNHDGTPAWRAAPAAAPITMLAIADLDQDGSPEILRGEKVLSADGSALFTGSAGSGSQGSFSATHGVDLVPSSPGLEVLAGYTAYTATGGIAWVAPGTGDGLTAVGDVDADGRPDVVVVRPNRLFLVDGETGAVRDAYTFLGNPSQPAMGDLTGDGRDEIVLPHTRALVALDWTGGLGVLWSVPAEDRSCCAAPALFDFDSDGALDVVHHDEVSWYIVDGPTGTILSDIPFRTWTGIETPVIVDLDHDGTTEILVGGCQLGAPDDGQLIVYECPDSAPARDTWNQFAYHVTNVRCDGTIPAVEPPPLAGPGWLAQQSEGGSCTAGADVTASCDGVQLHGEPGCAGGPVLWTSSCPGTTFLPSDDVLDPFVVLGGSCARACTLTLTAAGCADSMTVTIADISAPALAGVPTDTSADCGAVPPPATTVTASDACDPSPTIAFTERRVDGPCAGSYRLTRTWTAVDACGNTTSASQQVDVTDTTPPVVTESDALVACVWPPSHRMRCFGRETLAPAIMDDCSAPIAWAIDSCASDQPEDDLGDGAFEADCIVTGDLVCVRAERDGRQPEGRSYTVSIRAVDACGNASGPARIGRIHVPRDRRPGDSCSAPRR